MDIPFWVDSSVESLFVVASLPCMRTIYVYDPQRTGVDAKTSGAEDKWFHAGRISTISKPQPGSSVVRLLGTGAYGVAIEARTSVTLGSVETEGDALSISLGAGILNRVFRLINAAGEPVQPLVLASDPDSPLRFSATLPPLAVDVRLQGEWRTTNGEVVSWCPLPASRSKTCLEMPFRGYRRDPNAPRTGMCQGQAWMHSVSIWSIIGHRSSEYVR